MTSLVDVPEIQLPRLRETQGTPRRTRPRTPLVAANQAGNGRSQTDRAGIPIGWEIAGANRNDCVLLEPTLDAIDAIDGRGLLADGRHDASRWWLRQRCRPGAVRACNRLAAVRIICGVRQILAIAAGLIFGLSDINGAMVLGIVAMTFGLLLNATFRTTPGPVSDLWHHFHYRDPLYKVYARVGPYAWRFGAAAIAAASCRVVG